jgi:hypothetical protein
MVGILVDHDLISSPIPPRDDTVIVRCDVPVEIVKPEALPISAAKDEDVLRSKATTEVSVCPRLLDSVVRIGRATIMSDPFIVLGMNVGNIGMPFLVHVNPVFLHGSGLVLSCRGRTMLRPGSRRRSGSASRNVPTSYRCGVTAAVRLPAPSFILRKSSHANEKC